MSGGLIVDPFAGPGGWSEGLRMLDLADIGIELDPAVAKTICGRCTCVYPCLKTQLDKAKSVTDHGVFGGTTADQRRKIRKLLARRTG